MQIIRNERVVVDEWIRLEREDPIPAGGNLIVPFDRWLAETDAFNNRCERVGVCVSVEDGIEELAPHIHRWPVIAIEFREFKDGRGHSLARLLRDKLEYRGELRAVGDIGRDQVFFLARCGFDAFELRPDTDPASVLPGFADFSLRYQHASDRAPAINQLRSGT